MTLQHALMRPDDLQHVLDWAAEEGWNPGIEDAASFLATDPNGFFVARHQDVPIAAISLVNHSPTFAFLGLYICTPDWRGRGVGKALWDFAIQHAGTRTIGLDAVLAQQANYAASGFAPTMSTTRFLGTLPAQIARDRGQQVRDANPEDYAWIVELDARANGYSKKHFLSHWIAESETRKTLALADQSGFVSVRKCRVGAKVGPLVASSTQDAIELLNAAAQVFDGPNAIDLPEDNAALASKCLSLGMEPSFTTARMYRGPAPEPGPHLRAVATLELG